VDRDKLTHAQESRRIERLWSGGFGDQYTQRNLEAKEARGVFWRGIFERYPVRSVLEVGCNVGANLGWAASQTGVSQIWGVDINREALGLMRSSLPYVGAATAAARFLPFRDAEFDLVFTLGVLIHQPSPALPAVMAEVVRCSSSHILCGEYYSEEPVEVPYRGQKGALFKRDFGKLYQELWPDLTLVETGFLSRDQGWDDVTYWLFEKPGA